MLERSRVGEVPALSEGGTEGERLLQLAFGLDALGQNAGARPLGIGGDGGQDPGLVGVGPTLHE